MADLSTTTLMQQCLDLLRAGDQSARERLLRCAGERLNRLARKMLQGYPNVRRWEDTGDVLQSSLMRLQHSLDQLTPTTTRDYFRLAALHIRRQLLDLARHYCGPRGLAAHHDTAVLWDLSAAVQADRGDEPGQLDTWTAFHQQAGILPEEEREVFDLLWYQGLRQAEAAEILGISARTVKRRWQSARLQLYQALEGEMPE